jgi:selenide,water dikinase
LLFDPQTAGGLLAGVPAAQSAACLRALHAQGYNQACVIGQVLARSAAPQPVQLVV